MKKIYFSFSFNEYFTLSFIVFISQERDSYRSQLDSYEHDLTTSPALSSHHTQQSNRIEVLQKSLDGFKELVEKLEEEVAALQKEGMLG